MAIISPGMLGAPTPLYKTGNRTLPSHPRPIEPQRVSPVDQGESFTPSASLALAAAPSPSAELLPCAEKVAQQLPAPTRPIEATPRTIQMEACGSGDPVLEAAQRRTQRAESLLGQLQQGPLQLNGQEISQKDGFQAVRNDAWDRFQGALGSMNEAAKDSYQNVLTLVKSDFAQDPERVRKFHESTPDQQSEYAYGWQAVAAEKFAQNPTGAFLANGCFTILPQATREDIAAGSKHYLQASEGYLVHGGSPGQ